MYISLDTLYITNLRYDYDSFTLNYFDQKLYLAASKVNLFNHPVFDINSLFSDHAHTK